MRTVIVVLLLFPRGIAGTIKQLAERFKASSSNRNQSQEARP